MTGHSNVFTTISRPAVSACALIVVATLLAACAPLPRARAGLAATIPPATPPAVPANCGPEAWDSSLLVSLEAGYCFRHPTSFVPSFEAAPEQSVGGWSLALENRGRTMSLRMETSLINGQTLEQVVAEELSPYADEVTARVKQTRTTLGGAPAIILDGMPGNSKGRQLLVIHGERLHRLTLAPWQDTSFINRLPNRQADAQLLWDAVVSSFAFVNSAKE